MKIAVYGLLLGAAALVASTGVSQAQMFWPFTPQCKAGYTYDSAKNVCKVEKKKKVKKAKKKK